MDRYKTILTNSEALFKEKGSKFIGYAFPLKKEADIELHLNNIRELHPKATHHCYAYKLGLEAVQTRANDDGEPSNSAGKPILGQIESNELSNALVIVVRYYGGTKLGVGGLQTAYKAGAKLAIEANEIVEKEVPTFHKIQFPFDQQGIVDHLIKNLHGEIIEKQFSSYCTYEIIIPKAQASQFLERIKIERTIDLIVEN